MILLLIVQFLIFTDYRLLCRRTEAANVRFSDEHGHVYLLKQPTFDRRHGSSEGTRNENEKDYVSRPRGRHGIESSNSDYDNEVQSVMVLRLPDPYTTTTSPASSPSPAFDQDTTGRTKFTIAEGGFEADGELDDNGIGNGQSGNGPVGGDHSSVNTVTFHQSLEHQFATKVLTFRVGREKPTVRVIVWRKTAPNNRLSKYLCVAVYAFHSITNEFVVGHCPASIDQWPLGACLVDLLLPLKWWNPKHPPGNTYNGKEFAGPHPGHNRHTKVKLALSAFVSPSATSEKAKPSSSSNHCISAAPRSRDKSSPVSYTLTLEAQRSLRIIGDVELIYPSEYALLPLDNVVKVLVPTIDCYPGTIFTVPIFVHYEPQRLNNSSLYLLQLRARASGRLRILDVEDVYPDWTITYGIGDGGTVVTSTAYHRSISLNESWAGEVFVLVVKIESGGSSLPNGEDNSAQMTWSVRLVVGSAMQTSPDGDLSTSKPNNADSMAFSRSPPSNDVENSTVTAGKFGETVTTRVNVQTDQLDTLVVIGNDEIVNRAIITSRPESLSIRVISISQGGTISDVTQKSVCVSIDPASLKVSAECTSVYVDGTETKSNANAAIGVQYGSYRTVARYTVWYPELPVDIWLADPVLHAVTGWTVPADTVPQKHHQFRHRRHNEQLRSRIHRHAKRTTNSGCRQKFQETELKVYARFRTVDQTTGAQTYLGGVGRKVQLDLTQLAKPFLKVKNTTVARLVHTKYATFVEGINEGRTEIQLKSPVQRHIYGSSVTETANEPVHLRSLAAEVITGLFSHTELRTPYPPVYTLALYKSSVFFRRYQEGVVSLTLRYSDGHYTNLEALDASYYRLYVTTNGSVTILPGANRGRRRHFIRSRKNVDTDGIVLLPVRIFTIDDHAEGARLNVTLLPSITCQSDQSREHPLAFSTIPIEFPRKAAASARDDGPAPSSTGPISIPLKPPGPSAVMTSPSERKPADQTEREVQSYGNAPLLASISVSIFAVAGVLFAACAVREGWVTVKSFARTQFRQWRHILPFTMNMAPFIFASARRCSRRQRRRSPSVNSSSSGDEGQSLDSGRKKRKRNRPNEQLRLPVECTESSVVSAENEFVWLRPMSMTSSSSNGHPSGSMGAKSLNGDIERRSTTSHKSTNDKGRDNTDYVISENEFFDCCRSRRRSNEDQRLSKDLSICSSSSSTASSVSGSGLESRVDEEIFQDVSGEKVIGEVKAYRPTRKMSDIPNGYQRCSYVFHEGATTLPSGWSGSENYGSIESSNHCNKKHHHRHRRRRREDRNKHDSISDVFVQRLLSARSDPSVHVRPIPTTAEAAEAAVEAAKNRSQTNQSTSLKNGKQKPRSVIPHHFLSSYHSAASSDTASDLFWDSSTLGMNEAELRDYFSCLKESVT